MSVRHGWGWQPSQTASCRHVRHVLSVWAHWYAVHGQTAVASNSYTHTTWLIFWGSGSLVESKWCQYVMVEADSHLNHCIPHPHYTYTKCLRTLICCPWAFGSSLKQLYPHYLAQMLGFWVTSGVKMMSLRHGWGWQLLPTFTLDIYKLFKHIQMLSMGTYQ